MVVTTTLSVVMAAVARAGERPRLLRELQIPAAAVVVRQAWQVPRAVLELSSLL